MSAGDALAPSAEYSGIVYLLGSTSLGNGQTDAQDGVGTQLSLVGSTIEAVEELVDLGLVLHINTLLDQSGTNDGVDVVDSLSDTLATPLGLIAITELAGLVLSCFIRLLLATGRRVGEGRDEPVEAPEGTMARWRPVSVTMSTSTVGLPRES